MFKISSLYELKPKSMYGNLMLRDVRTQMEITLRECGKGCEPFLYVCYVCHFTTCGVLVTTSHGPFFSFFSTTFVQCSCLFPNMKVKVSQCFLYRSYSPCVSVCNTFPKHKPAKESDVWLTVHRNSVWIRKTN